MVADRVAVLDRRMPQVGDATTRFDNIGVAGLGAQPNFSTSARHPNNWRGITKRAAGSVQHPVSDGACTLQVARPVGNALLHPALCTPRR